MSHTEDSQLLGAPVQKKLPGQCCTQDVDTSVIVTHLSLQRCKKGNEASLPCRYRQHLLNCGHVVFHRSYAAAGGRNEPLLVTALGLKG